MAFRIQPEQRMDKEARRVLMEQIERAEKRLRSSDDRAVSVHEARKHFKRVRAALRLLRPAIGKAAYKRENAAMRDVARLLAGARDAHVMLQTLAALEAEYGLDRDRDTREVRRALESQSVQNGAQALDAAIDKALRQLKGARGRLGRMKIATGIDLLAEGLKRCHREARDALAEASGRAVDEKQNGDSDAAWHELRKCIQRHWRHMGLLNDAWPEYFAARAKAAKRLSAMLGDDHDLAVLAAFLDTTPREAASQGQVEAITILARDRQLNLRKAAIVEAERLFSDRPGDFARRFGVAWRSACLLAAAQTGTTTVALRAK